MKQPLNNSFFQIAFYCYTAEFIFIQNEWRIKSYNFVHYDLNYVNILLVECYAKYTMKQ